jgi:hypothetical protein
METFRQGAQKQTTFVQQAKTRIETMMESIWRIQKEIEQVVQRAQSTLHSAQIGNKQIQKTEQKMRTIQTKIRGTYEKLGEGKLHLTIFIHLEGQFMNKYGYFNPENYTSNHLHVDNWKDEFTPYLEAIAWERQDGTMDLFFNDFEDDQEYQTLFGDKEHYYDKFKGVFLDNVKTNEEAYEKFRKWVNEVLYPYRNRAK